MAIHVQPVFSWFATLNYLDTFEHLTDSFKKSVKTAMYIGETTMFKIELLTFCFLQKNIRLAIVKPVQE